MFLCKQTSAFVLLSRCASALILALVLALLSACQSAQVGQPLTEKTAGNDVESQLEFWHTLAERSLTSNDEAFHAVLLFLDGKDDAQDYAGRVAVLQERGLLDKGFTQPAQRAIQRGTLARVLAPALQVRGGLLFTVLGPVPRYADRELTYAGVFPEGSINQTFSGSQFVGVMGRVEDYQRRHPVVATQ